MSGYTFPEALDPLRRWLARHHVDVTAIKSERQALHLAARIGHQRATWPRRGQSCFPELRRLQTALCGRFSHKYAPAREERAKPASTPRSASAGVSREVAARYGASMGNAS